jgi:hypothetical protein
MHDYRRFKVSVKGRIGRTALTPAKRAAHLKVVEMIRPAVETGSVPLCSRAEEAESVSA